MSENTKYFFERVKILRDLVHGYINLTEFDLQIINTSHFQRLKDIRQLTCQHVYPAARHTRFEHSLGVLELTRNALRYLNENGILDDNNKKNIIDESLMVNVAVAALLHDVGHCVFSHMGETQFETDCVKSALLEAIEDISEGDSKEINDLMEFVQKNSKIGAVHEQLSCISIIINYYDILKSQNSSSVKIDFVFICRCILGIKYPVKTVEYMKKYQLKNALVSLINSPIFDMDKLDYIMRDAFYTGIGVPAIDTKRLFKNMCFDRDYNIIFKSKAVPSLQNMIESRDGLYMYVYNHHSVIYTDFVYTYVIRRMVSAADDFALLKDPRLTEQDKLGELLDNLCISGLGIVPRPYLFSVNSVVSCCHSDSDFISLVNIIGYNGYDDVHTITEILKGELGDDYLPQYQSDVENLAGKIKNTISIVQRLQSRNLLMPWWKTVYEFADFMRINFPDDITRRKVGRFICEGGEFGMNAEVFRSQLGKHTIYVYNNMLDKRNPSRYEFLNDGDFFVAQRATRFLGPETIEQLRIALERSHEYRMNNDGTNGDFYMKSLTSIIPQKDYKATYAKEGFYVYSSRSNVDNVLLKRVFVFVATEMVEMGEQYFVNYFQFEKEEGCTILEHHRKKAVNEKESQKIFLDKFRKLRQR